MQETKTIKENTGWESLFPSPAAGKITLKVGDKGKNVAGVAPSPRPGGGGPGNSPSPSPSPAPAAPEAPAPPAPAAPGAGDPGARRYTS